MHAIKILYLHLFESYKLPSLLISFIRISNYLNSKLKNLSGNIDEEILDFQFEKVPEFVPQNLEIFRKELKKLLEETHKRFNFNLVAISCYSSHLYVKAAEVANIIKHLIDPSCLIVVGGVHPTIYPEDFQPGNLPDVIYDTYPKATSPFDYIIVEEAEVPFFKLVRDLINGKAKIRKNLKESAILLEPEIIKDLNELPIIDLRLFEKYKDAVKEFSYFYLDFSRGCPFRCKFCTNSTDYIQSYKMVRIKTVKKCIEELNVIKNTKWLKIDNLYISDPVFLPNKKKREEFYEELNKIFKEEGGLPFKIQIYERVELCSDYDLQNYKEFSITPHIGFESSSKKMLFLMGKILGKNDAQIKKNIDRFLLRVEEIIKESNKLDLQVIFYYITSYPGSDRNTIAEEQKFFLEPRYNGLSIIEKFKINLSISKYAIYPGSEVFHNAEERFGSKIYYKKWWRRFEKYQPYLPAIVEPSENLSLVDSMLLTFDFMEKLFKTQIQLGNEFYSLRRLFLFKFQSKIFFRILNELLQGKEIKPSLFKKKLKFEEAQKFYSNFY